MTTSFRDKFWGPIASAVALLVFASTARAQLAPTQSVDLRYDASPTCPSRGQFVSSVGARTAKIRWKHGLQNVVLYDVELTIHGELAIGRMTVRAPGEPVRQHQVSGSTCDEVADALALSLALSIDPEAASPKKPAPLPPKPTPPQRLARSHRPFRTSVPQQDSRWTVGVTGLGITNVAPGPLWGGGVELTRFVTRYSLVPPNFQVSLSGAATVNVQQGAESRFRLLSGRLAWLPVYFEIANGWDVASGVGLQIGQLHAQGADGVALAKSSNVLWLAGDVTGRLRIRPAEHWSVEPWAMMALPTVRPSYTFDNPTTAISTVGPVCISIGVSLNVVLPP